MKHILFSVLALALFTSPVWTQKTVRTKALITEQTAVSKRENSNLLTEEFSFLIGDFKMNHQSEVNNLNIKVRLLYENNISDSKYPDFRAIAKDIEEFLNNYPNKIDYWEILNKKLTLLGLAGAFVRNVTLSHFGLPVIP